MICTCGSIGAANIVRLCSLCHRYWLGDRELVSVSKVIGTVYPKKSWDNVDKKTIEKARYRGERVDYYLSEYVATGNVTMEPGELGAVRQRVDMVIDWWDRNVNGQHVEVKRIVHSERDGVAGETDFVIGDAVIDLKNTAQIEKSYKLQMGAYGEYLDAGSLHVLHVAPKLYPREGGCRLIPFDVDACRALWRQAASWYRTIREIEN